MISPSTAPTALVRQRTIAPLAFAFIFFLGSAQVSGAQRSDLQTAASKLDNIITKKHKTKVIITDFIGPKNAVTEYGQAIADDLSAQLALQNANLIVIPRRGQSFTFGSASFSQDFKEGSAAVFLAHSVGAEVVVTGDFEKHSDKVDLNLSVWDGSSERKMPGEKLGGFAIRLSTTPEQIALIAHTISGDPQDGFRLTAGNKPAALASMPVCIACPALTGVGRADVNLVITVSAKGLVTNVELISASDQKIAGKMIQAVMKWRFRPARGPDGQPIETKIPLEVSLGNKIN